MCKALLEFAHRVEADLIMIMTQQETEVIKYFVGSLAKEIIHNSDIPVMSIVPKSR
jgi:nucleotide-binding universal stress UspA family protein